MASYEKRNNTWSVRFREDTCKGKTNRRISGFESQEAAEAAFNEWEENYNSRISTSDITPTTFDELLTLYLERSKGRNKESSYYTTLSKINSHIRPFFSNYELSKITPTIILKWQNLLTRYSFKYRALLNNLLSSIFRFAYRYYDIKNPMEKVEPLRNLDAKREMKIWSEEEFKKYIQSVDEDIFYLFFRFLYISGCRKGEALALNFEDIDFENGTVRINKNLTRKVRGQPFAITTPKNQYSNRAIEIPSSFLSELLALRKSDEDIFVFGGTYPLADSTIRRRHLTWIKKSGVKKITIHEIRHSHASLLLSRGVSIVAVSRRLGHSSIKQTLDTYSHIMPSDIEKIVGIFEDF